MNAATFLGETRTQPGWTLVDLGLYPGLVAGEGHVEGELYDAPENAIRELDAYEGVDDGHYERITITLEDGSTAETYRYTGRMPTQPTFYPAW